MVPEECMLETTMNLSSGDISLLVRAAGTLGMSVNRIAALLLRRMVLRRRGACRLFRTVDYQRRKGGESWICLHVRISGKLHEQCFDLRKFWKRSVSRLLAEAIQDDLALLVKEIVAGKYDRNQDNYHFSFTETNEGWIYTLFLPRNDSKSEKKPFF